MKAQQIKTVILAVLLLVLGNLGLSQVRAEAHFAEKVSQAKRLLATLPAGWNFAMGLESYGTYIDAVRVRPQVGSIFNRYATADGGGIGRLSDGTYEIYINPAVSVERMAHTLAHELQHIRDEMTADRILEQSPDLKDSIDETVAWIRMGDGHRAMSERPVETNYIMKALFCTEYRAHTLNLLLQREGLGDFFLKNDQELLEHINYGYIHRYGFRLAEEQQAHLAAKCAYRRLKEHEPSPMQTLLESTLLNEPGATDRT